MGDIASKCFLFSLQTLAILRPKFPWFSKFFKFILGFVKITAIIVCHRIFICKNINRKRNSKRNGKRKNSKDIDSPTKPEKIFRTHESEKQSILKQEETEEKYIESQNKKLYYRTLSDLKDIYEKSQITQRNNNVPNNIKEKKIRPQSLMNIGSTCYLNSALQGLSSCSIFVEEITSLVHESQNKYQKLSIFHDLIRILNDKAVVNRIEISKNAIFRQWNKPGQQDSFELLAYVLNEVYGDIRKCRELSGELVKDIQEWLKVKLPMRIIIRYGIICGNGHQIKMPLQSDLALHVPISWNLNLNLQNFVDSYFKEDRIQDYVCDERGCNSANCYRTTRLVLPLPRTICVHLQRTFCKDRKMIKINENIKFDITLKIKSKFCVERNEDNEKKNLEQNLNHPSSIEIGNEKNGKENVIGGHNYDDLINDGLNNEKESGELGVIKKISGKNEENSEFNKVTENVEKLLNNSQDIQEVIEIQDDENRESTSRIITDVLHDVLFHDSLINKQIMEEEHDENEEPRPTKSVENEDMKEKELGELGLIEMFYENQENEFTKVEQNGEKLLDNSQDIQDVIEIQGDENRKSTSRIITDVVHDVLSHDSLIDKQIMEEEHDENEEPRPTKSVENEDMKEKELGELGLIEMSDENEEKLLDKSQGIEVIEIQGDENRESTSQIMADIVHEIVNDSLKDKQIVEDKCDRTKDIIKFDKDTESNLVFISNMEKHSEVSKEIIVKELVETKIYEDTELTIQLSEAEVTEIKYDENAKPKTAYNAQDKDEHGNYSNKEKQIKEKNYSENEEDNEKHEIFYLTSVIVHYGSAHGGHYVCYKCVEGRWFLTNDSEIREVEEKEVLNCQAYILFYEKP